MNKVKKPADQTQVLRSKHRVLGIIFVLDANLKVIRPDFFIFWFTDFYVKSTYQYGGGNRNKNKIPNNVESEKIKCIVVLATVAKSSCVAKF